MRQRVMIAMALAVDPEVVIMDEPTTGARRRRPARDPARDRRAQERLGFAVLFITHDLSLLLEIADRIVIMYAGQVVESAPTEQIHHGGAHPYTRGLLGLVPERARRAPGSWPASPGSPPDLRAMPPGCPFIPRCAFATDACRERRHALVPVAGLGDSATSPRARS